MNKTLNPILATDSYKLSHKGQLPPNTTKMYSHLTPRFVKYLKQKFPDMDDKVIVYGIQSTITLITENWENNFFKQDWGIIEKETLHVLTPHLGWSSKDLQHFKELHELGYLPLEFKALPEGSHVEINIPVLTIQNTHDDYAWLVNFIEPPLLNTIFKPMTVATLGLELAKLRNYYFNLTVEDQSGIDFALHDFSYRGQSGHESAAHTSSAYLLYTKGTDTLSAISFAQKYYNAPENLAYSLNAGEHSTVTLNIQLYRNVLQTSSHEEAKVSEQTYALGIQACRRVRDKLISKGASLQDIELAVGETFTLVRFLLEVYPTGLFAYVSDSYDYYRLINDIIPELKDIILNRDGKLILRPDSANPVDVVCGTGDIINIPEKYNNSIEAAHNFVKNIVHDTIANETPHGEQGETEERVLFNYKDKLYSGVVELEWNRYDKQYYYIESTCLKNVEETILSVQEKGTIESLWETFGGTVNSFGYKCLDSHIGLVYGDGITYPRMKEIYQKLHSKKYAVSNICLAPGAYLLAHISRDDLGFALKNSMSTVDNTNISVYKAPATDLSKASKAGLFKVELTDKGYVLFDNVSEEEEKQGKLKTVWKNGKFTLLTTFDEIKSRLPL